MRGYIIASTAVLLSGCIAYTKAAKISVDQAVSQRQIVCIDKVQYIATPIGISPSDGWALAPHYRPDGTLFGCNN